MSVAPCFSPWSLIQSFSNSESLELMCDLILEASVRPQAMSAGAYVVLFTLTCLLESPVYFYFCHKKRFSKLKSITQLAALNVATHPAVTWLFPLMFSRGGTQVRTELAAAEMFAIVIEAAILKHFFGYGTGSAVAASTAANLTSWWLGLYIGPSLINSFLNLF